MTVIERLSTPHAITLVKEIDLDEYGRKTMDFCMLMSTDMWAGFIDDKLACIWGVIPPSLMSNQAYLWLHTTDAIKTHEFRLVRHSQIVMEQVLSEYSSVVGHAVIGSDKSIRWLKWLGAKFGPPQGIAIPFRISKDG